MEKILNRVIDALMDDHKFEFTEEELDSAIYEQTKKVVHHLSRENGMTLFLGLSVLYLLCMTKENTTKIEFPMFDISGSKPRSPYRELRPKAMGYAEEIFMEKEIETKRTIMLLPTTTNGWTHSLFVWNKKHSTFYAQIFEKNSIHELLQFSILCASMIYENSGREIRYT